MSARYTAGREAAKARGRATAVKWLLARRLTQFGILGLFLAGPVSGVWIVKGNFASSLTLETLPLTDPFVLLQSLIAGHAAETTAVTGALIVLAFYALVGGRSFCAWVCPLNPVTDLAHWGRQKMGLSGGVRFARATRYWLLGVVLAAALITGTLAWELINPVTAVFRGLVFGLGAAAIAIAAVFVLDLFVGRRAWCGHLCPMGAFYSIVGAASVVRVSAAARDRCDDCMDCFAVCPEPHVINPALKGAEAGTGPVILSPNCTNCGRCIDVCPTDVFAFASRFANRRAAPAGRAPRDRRRDDDRAAA